jgi:hypothetical protein
MHHDEDKYWYNLNTGEVEFGRLSPGSDRVGPFDSHDEAANALELLRQRAQAWADDDAAESGWPDPDAADDSTNQGW